MLNSFQPQSAIRAGKVSFAGTSFDITDCEKLQADLKRLTNELSKCRQQLNNYTAGLDERTRQIQELSKDIFDNQLKLEVLEKEKGSFRYAMLDMYLTGLRNRKIILEKEKREYERKKASSQREEMIIVNSFHLVRDRIDKECGGVKKEPPAKTFPAVGGRYNSPYGDVQVTQETGNDQSTITAVVYYADENGGTSRLQGPFDGVTWNYTWRNSFKHFGTGKMTYDAADRSFKGYWIDNFVKPPNRGNWWLRIK